MKTQFFGSYLPNQLSGIKPEEITKTESENLAKLNAQYSFKDENVACFAWGNFYDLKKSCQDLQVEVSDNPAEILAKSVKPGKYDAISAFYGEFAFILTSENTVVIGRDYAGAGLPVFYNDKFFASQIDEFKHIKSFDFSPDHFSIRAFLHLGSVLPPATIIKGIKQLAPGEYLIYSDGKISIRQIYPFEKYNSLFASLKISEQDAIKELENLHTKSIKRRIEGRSNVALLLSGGYDSGGNVAALREVYNGQVNGYSIGFKNDQWSELPLAKLLADRFKLNFHDYIIDGSEVEELPKIMRFLSNPFQENGVMVNYAVMKMVSKDSNDIILGGDGNDQLYGTGMRELALYYLASKNGIKPFQNLLNGLLGITGANQKLLSRVNFHNSRILHATSFTTFGFPQSELDNLLNDNKQQLITDILKRNNYKAKTFDELFVAHTYYKDLMNDGLNLIIFKAANMARLFSQNLSFPYVDKDILEFIGKLPRELRFSGSVKEIAKAQGKSKYLHKKYLYPKLPKEITERKKQGGFAPLPVFFKDNERRQRIMKIIRESQMAKEILNTKYLEKFLQQYEQLVNTEGLWFWHEQSMAFKMYNLLVLAIWWEIHFENNKGELLRDFA